MRTTYGIGIFLDHVVMPHAVLVQQFKGIVPEAVDAKVQVTGPGVTCDVRQMVVRCFDHNLFMF